MIGQYTQQHLIANALAQQRISPREVDRLQRENRALRGWRAALIAWIVVLTVALTCQP